MTAINPTEITVDIYHGPAGSRGFRSGEWSAEYDGATFRFFGSVSHYADLDQQRSMLQRQAARHLEKSRGNA